MTLMIARGLSQRDVKEKNSALLEFWEPSSGVNRTVRIALPFSRIAMPIKN